MKVRVRYFASLREQTGISGELVDTSEASILGLWGELTRRYHFSLPLEVLRCAVDDEFQSLSAPLTEGSTVVFLPPVSGG